MTRIQKLMGHKTFKREVAVFLLAVWTVATFYLFFNMPVEKIKVLEGIYTMLSMSVFSFALGSFGLDAVMKSMNAPVRTSGGDDATSTKARKLSSNGTLAYES